MRKNPMIWEDEEAPQGVLAPMERGPDLDVSGDLSLLNIHSDKMIMTGLISPSEEAGPLVYETLAQISEALQMAIAENKGSRIELDHLTGPDRKMLFDALGEGEVKVTLSPGTESEGSALIQETVLPGVWRGHATDKAGDLETYWIEVSDAPRALRKATIERPRAQLDLETLEAPRDTMNVMGVLAEVGEKSATWEPGTENHVINFTLFPMTPADSAFLARTLGEVGIEINSGGYGVARVILTAVPNVWAVQYLNGLGTVILDTLEIGDIPSSVLASIEDFEDSAERLDEIRDTYA